MKRYSILFTLLVVSALLVGCGGAKELPPDGSQVKPVDPAEIQRQIQEGMKKSGAEKQSEFAPSETK